MFAKLYNKLREYVSDRNPNIAVINSQNGVYITNNNFSRLRIKLYL